MSQVATDIVWSDDPTSANSLLNAARLTSFVGDIWLLNSAVTGQTDYPITQENDRCLVGPASVTGPTGLPVSSTLVNLLPETVRNLSKLYANSTQVVHTVIASGTIDLYTVTLTPAATTLVGGMTVRWKAPVANTLPVQVAVNLATTAGAATGGNPGTYVPLMSIAGAALAAGNIVAGQVVEMIYDDLTATFVATSLVGGGTLAASQLSESVRMSAQQYSTDSSSTANTFIITLTPQLSSITAGMVIRWKAAHANSGACVVQVNTVTNATTRSLVKYGAAALISGDVVAGQLCEAVYDGSNWYLLNPGGNNITSYFRAGSFTTTDATNVTVNFTSAVPSASYAVECTSTSSPTGTNIIVISKSTSSFTAQAYEASGTKSWDYIIMPYT